MDRREFLAGGAAVAVAALCPVVVGALTPVLETVVEPAAFPTGIVASFAEFQTSVNASSALTMAALLEARKVLQERKFDQAALWVLPPDLYAELNHERDKEGSS